MLEEGKPDLAFPGGDGTANRIKQAREAQVQALVIATGA